MQTNSPEMNSLLNTLPEPAELYDLALEIAENFDSRYEYEVFMHRNYVFVTISQGGGDDGFVCFVKEHEEIVGAMISVYINEDNPNMLPNISVQTDDLIPFPSFVGLPEIFQSVVNEDSPVLLDLSEYPATTKQVFSAGAVWYSDELEGWQTSEAETGLIGEPVDYKQVSKDILYILKDFNF